MKCMNCNAEIVAGSLYCPKCGTKVQIVPDYNPLDDVLVEQVKGAVNGGTFTLPIKEISKDQSRRTKSRTQGTSVSKRRPSGDTNPSDEQIQRKRKARRKKELQKRKQRRMLVVLAAIGLLLSILLIVLYQNSYSGQVGKGYKALNDKQYDEAIGYFEKAVSKNSEKAKAYVGLSKVYQEQKNLETAESTLLDAINANKANVDLYKAIVSFYEETDQLKAIPILLDACEEDTVLAALSDYIVKVPEFSLTEKVYEDVQALSLVSKGNTVHFVLDDSEITQESPKYESAIQIEEGTVTIRAVAYNKKGIPSSETQNTYSVEFPVEDAPAVTPSTGQYEKKTEITIKVPTGYTAYYTLDGNEPTASSKKYVGPVQMPEGNTIFSAIIVNSRGKASKITKRNYDLTLEN